MPLPARPSASAGVFAIHREILSDSLRSRLAEADQALDRLGERRLETLEWRLAALGLALDCIDQAGGAGSFLIARLGQAVLRLARGGGPVVTPEQAALFRQTFAAMRMLATGWAAPLAPPPFEVQAERAEALVRGIEQGIETALAHLPPRHGGGLV